MFKTIPAKYKCKFCGKVEKAEAVECALSKEEKELAIKGKLVFECICDKCSNKDE